MSPSNGLTLKQRKWIEIYLETGNASEAAMQVYDVKDRLSAAQIGWENLRKLDFGAIMEEAGITDKKLNEKLAEGLESNKVVSARTTGKDADERTDDFIEVPDMPTRHKYLETALKLKHRLGTEDSTTVNVENVTNNLVIYKPTKNEEK